MSINFSRLDFYCKYRDYPGFSGGDIAMLRSNYIGRMLSAPVVKMVSSGIFCSVLVSVKELDWDSTHFNLSMARVDVLCAGDAHISIVSKVVLDAVYEYRRKTGCRHYSIEVDLDDYPVMNACFSAGFEVLDYKRTYFTNRVASQGSYKKFSSNIRHYELSDRGDVLALVAEVPFSTRFTRDRYLDQSRAQKMYALWFERLLDAYPHESNVLVSIRHGGIVSCAAIGQIDFSEEGIERRIRGGSVYASRSEGVGMYAAAMLQLTKEALVSHDLIEATVSLNSSSAIRVLEGIRPNRSVMHCCLRLFLPD